MTTIKATSALGEASELAPFDGTVDVAAAAALVASTGAADDDAVESEAVDDGAVAALSAGAMSLGNIKGVDETLARLMEEPSAPTMSWFIAIVLRVKRMFSAASEWAQVGKADRSIEPPHDLAKSLVLFDVTESEYET